MNDRIRALLRLEPVAVRTLIAAVAGLALSLGVDLHGDQLLEAADALLPLLAMLPLFASARQAVTPNAKVAVRTDEIRG
jgi:hypothetical protein